MNSIALRETQGPKRDKKKGPGCRAQDRGANGRLNKKGKKIGKAVDEIINLQPLKDGKAKAYQVKQVRMIILKYRFHKGDTNA